MSESALILSMERLLMLHKSLLELAEKKTDILKKGDMEALDQVMKDEQKHIAAIGKVEEERIQLAKQIVEEDTQPTVAACLEKITGANHERLTELRDALLQLVFRIQEKNELNQKMLYQSLQFVNLSLSLLVPQPQNFNYGPPANYQKPINTSAKGIFNSKA